MDRATCHHTYRTGKTSRGKERGKGKGKGGGKTTVLSSPCKSRESPGAPRGGGQFDFAPVCVVVVVVVVEFLTNGASPPQHIQRP